MRMHRLAAPMPYACVQQPNPPRHHTRGCFFMCADLGVLAMSTWRITGRDSVGGWSHACCSHTSQRVCGLFSHAVVWCCGQEAGQHHAVQMIDARRKLQEGKRLRRHASERMQDIKPEARLGHSCATADNQSLGLINIWWTAERSTDDMH